MKRWCLGGIIVILCCSLCPAEEHKNGLFRTYYDNGRVKTLTQYKNGVRHGMYKKYYENGSLLGEGNFKNGKPDGIFKEYAEDGEILSVETYEQGKLIERKEGKKYQKPHVLATQKDSPPPTVSAPETPADVSQADQERTLQKPTEEKRLFKRPTQDGAQEEGAAIESDIFGSGRDGDAEDALKTYDDE